MKYLIYIFACITMFIFWPTFIILYSTYIENIHTLWFRCTSICMVDLVLFLFASVFSFYD